MFLDGLLSLVQICFLPGFVVLGLFNLNAIDRTVLAFPISLLANYVLVYLLTLLGWYTKDVLIAVFIIEIVLLFILYTKYAKHRMVVAAAELLTPPDWKLSPILKALFLLLAIFASAWLFFKIIDMIPSHFTYYDDMCNWNRWAVDWYKGQLPFRTWEYPQILPINWSITYKWMGNYEFEYFATFANGLIALYVLGAFWGMYFDSRRDVFLVAVSIAALWLYFFLGAFIGNGMADVPSAFFGVMMVYVAYLGIFSKISLRQFIILGALIVAGAALTKQAGNYLIVYYVCVAIFLARKSNLSVAESAKSLVVGFSIIFLLAWSWYIYHRWQVELGLERTNITHVTTNIHEGRSYWKRFIAANADINVSISKLDLSLVWPSQVIFWVGMFIVCILIYFSLQSVFGMFATLAVTIPFYFIWALFFSYGNNQRNFGLALGFLTVSMAFGLTYLCANTLPMLRRKNPRLFNWVLIGLIMTLTVTGLNRLNKYISHEFILSSKLRYLTNDLNAPILNIEIYKEIYAIYGKGYFSSPDSMSEVKLKSLMSGARGADVERYKFIPLSEQGYYPEEPGIFRSQINLILYGAGYSYQNGVINVGVRKVLTNYACDRCNAFPGTNELFETFEPDDIPSLEKLLFSGEYEYYLLWRGLYSPKIYTEGVDTLVREKRLLKVLEGDGLNGKYFLYKIQR